MTKRKYEKPLYLDMPFGEALERYIGTDPRELEEVVARSKGKSKKKPPGAGTPGGSQGQDLTVVRLRDRRKPNHR